MTYNLFSITPNPRPSPAIILLKAFCFIPAVTVILLAAASAAEVATTKDGRSVLLKDDGTWEFIEVVQPARTGLEIPKKSREPDFRNVWWGMSKSQVKKAEKGELVFEKEDMIVHKASLAGLFGNVFYVFHQNRLVKAKYHFTEQRENTNTYIDDYNTLKEHLIHTCGEPTDYETRWNNDMYKEDFEKWGLAVSLGHLTYSADFATETTDITLALSGENAQANLVIEYSPKQQETVEDEKKKSSEIQPAE